MKLTPWYPGNVKPVRVGVYERDYPGEGIYFCKWNGKRWHAGNKKLKLAKKVPIPSFSQSLPWRGIAKEQK